MILNLIIALLLFNAALGAWLTFAKRGPKHDDQSRRQVKDKISGFTGIVSARHEYLNGCVRFSVEPDKLNKDGVRIEGSVFDLEQLDLVKAAKVRVTRPGGGPRNEPSRPSVPSR